MNELIVVEKPAEWKRLKALVLDSVSSPITRRVYNMALDEFIDWFGQAPRPGFSKATVSAWRASLETRGLGSSSIIIRMSAIRKLAFPQSCARERSKTVTILALEHFCDTRSERNGCPETNGFRRRAPPALAKLELLRSWK